MYMLMHGMETLFALHLVRQYAESFARAALLMRTLCGKKTSSWTSNLASVYQVGSPWVTEYFSVSAETE